MNFVIVMFNNTRKSVRIVGITVRETFIVHKSHDESILHQKQKGFLSFSRHVRKNLAMFRLWKWSMLSWMVPQCIWTNEPMVIPLLQKEKANMYLHIDTPLLHSLALTTSSSSRMMPSYHSFSRYHYEILYKSRYGHVMSYVEYCQLEEKLAMMVLERHSILCFDDPWWMDDQSIISYFTKEERSNIKRVLEVDLSQSQTLLPVIRIEPDLIQQRQPLFHWHSWSVPRV